MFFFNIIIQYIYIYIKRIDENINITLLCDIEIGNVIKMDKDYN